MYKLQNKFDYFNVILLCLLFSFPLIPIKFIGFLGVLTSVLLIINNYKKSKDHSTYNKKNFLLSFLFYFALCFSLVYSQDFSEGLKEILKMLLLFIFPVAIIKFLKVNNKSLDFLISFFLIINIILCIYIFNLVIDILSYKKMTFLIEANFFEKVRVFVLTPYNIPFNWSSRDFNIYLFFHKAYISLSLTLSGLIAVYQIFYTRRKLQVKVLLIGAFGLFSFFIFYMESIPNIVCFLLGIILFVSNFLYKKSKKIFLIFAVILLVLGVMNVKNDKYTNFVVDKVVTDIRNEIWNCGWEVSKSNLLFGVGIGDQEKEIANCYKSKNSERYQNLYSGLYNTHNQYLSFVSAAGLFCLILFLLLLLNNFINAYKKNDILFMTFIILIAINFLFENILDRIYGVFFFGLFNSIFIKRNTLINN